MMPRAGAASGSNASLVNLDDMVTASDDCGSGQQKHSLKYYKGSLVVSSNRSSPSSFSDTEHSAAPLVRRLAPTAAVKPTGPRPASMRWSSRLQDCANSDSDDGQDIGQDRAARRTKLASREATSNNSLPLTPRNTSPAVRPVKDDLCGFFSTKKSASLTSLVTGPLACGPEETSELVDVMLSVDQLKLQLPRGKLRVLVGTWNMNNQKSPAHLTDFLLPQNVTPDMLAIGTQENVDAREWEARLQATLGPWHVLFHSHSLGTLHLAVFLRRDLIWYCSMPEVDAFSTRPTATFSTKGAVAMAFTVFGTSFLLVNCHLTAHQQNIKDRVKDLKKIHAMLNLPKALPLCQNNALDISDRFDCVFWCGDLNFRLEQSRHVVLRELLKDGRSVLDFDQLTFLRSEGLLFRGFREDEITFPPTYKYDPGTNNFDTSSKQRVPSYTDRILYKHKKRTPVSALNYDSVSSVTTSDHKPVWGMWEALVQPAQHPLPMSGGLFSREIYLEGLKRRFEELRPSSGNPNKTMCSIQ